MPEPEIRDNPSAHRFELKIGDKVAAYAEYNVLSHALLFTHTEVLPEFEGAGHGSRLAKFALDAVRSRGLKAIPACQFIAGYIRKHAEYHDLVADEHRRAYHI
ncbi:N-acetyltransferase [Ramlibacter sp. XY19]|uniref:GNAT family N-acetyltransferase n=1 Tax=Ramlibacter paludis TaxID=2908000 RepID=UPI0023D99782|nr:GNAT family N-acetyltransferase [Ramlibacter paludis]MCG2594223.1 N-acetyltransferase [Ramlibacter paludis]